MNHPLSWVTVVKLLTLSLGFLQVKLHLSVVWPSKAVSIIPSGYASTQYYNHRFRKLVKANAFFIQIARQLPCLRLIVSQGCATVLYWASGAVKQWPAAEDAVQGFMIPPNLTLPLFPAFWPGSMTLRNLTYYPQTSNYVISLHWKLNPKDLLAQD